MASRTR